MTIDDLISRKAAIESIKDPVVKGFALYALKSVPSVPAVPIKAISAWLAAYAAPPKYALVEIAGTDPGRIVTVDTLVRAWEYHWKNLMECGLLQEEQDGTDNP